MNTTPRMRRLQAHSPAHSVAPATAPMVVADRSGGLRLAAVTEPVGPVRGRRCADLVSPSGGTADPGGTSSTV
jgi:hypothetical protein